MTIDLILDTDIGTDVDDALAVAFAIAHPDINLRAVTTVSADTTLRARIAKKLLMFAGRDDVEVAAGVRGEQSHPQRRADNGEEHLVLGDDAAELPISERDAVTLLLEEFEAASAVNASEARAGARRPLELAVVGMQSNVAAAVERDPSFVHDVSRVCVMGGVFAPVMFLGHELPPSVDHNLNVDQAASLRALNTPMRRLYVGCDVTMGTWFTRRQLDALRGGDLLCRELARQIDLHLPHLYRGGRGVIPEEYVALMHDPLAVACMVDRRFVTSTTAKVTAAMHHGHVRTFIDPVAGFGAEIITSVDWRRFSEFWLETVLR
jgi:purine nucleosidase